MPEYRRCTSCGKRAPVRADGTLGRHFTSSAKVRQRCAGGEIGRRPNPTGRRITVTVTAVVPYTVAGGEFRTLVADLVRERADAFVVDVGAEPTDAGCTAPAAGDTETKSWVEYRVEGTRADGSTWSLDQIVNLDGVREVAALSGGSVRATESRTITTTRTETPWAPVPPAARPARDTDGGEHRG